MRLSQRQQSFTVNVGLLLIRANRYGVKLTFGAAWRNTERLKCPKCKTRHNLQELLFFNGRSKVKVGGKHAQRLAIDLIVWRAGKPVWSGEAYRMLGQYWESLGGRWGGRFKPLDKNGLGWDAGHFEGH